MNTSAALPILDRIDALCVKAESEGRDFTPDETETVEMLQGLVNSLIGPPEDSMQKATFEKTRTVPPAGPSIVVPQDRDPILDAIRASLDPSYDAGYVKEVSAEMRHRMPWLTGVKNFDHGLIVPVPRQSGTNPGAPMEPLVGIEYDDTLVLTGNAITQASIVGALGMRELTGLTERTVSFSQQTAQLSAAHTAIDSAMHTSQDPAFGTVTATPRLFGGIHTLLLSAIWAQHPPIGNVSWVSQELIRAMAAELNRVVIAGDSTGTSGVEPDGLEQFATAATQALITASTATVAELNALKQEMEAYLQVTSDATRMNLIHHPNWAQACESVAAFAGSGTSVWSDITAGAAARMDYTPSLALPVDTVPTPDAADCYLVSEPQQALVHAMWGALSVSSNPYGETDYARGSTAVRCYALHDLVCRDPKRVLATKTDLAAT